MIMKFFKIFLLLCLTHFTIEPSATADDAQTALAASTVGKCWKPLARNSIALLAPSTAPTGESITKAVSLLRA